VTVVTRVNNCGDQINVDEMSGTSRRLVISVINSGAKYKMRHK